MDKEKVKEFFRKRTVKIGSAVLAAALVFSGGMLAWNNSRNAVPELVTFVDTEGSVEIPGEDVPLGVPKVTKSTKTKKTTKKIKMKTKSKKTYVQKGKSSQKSATKTQKNGNTTTTTVTVTATDIKNQFKKGSNIKTQVTTVKTTVTKTVLEQDSRSASAASSADAAVNISGGQPAAVTAMSGDVAVNSIASGADARVLNAFTSLGFKVTVNSGVNYSGLFDARTRAITLKKADATVYHELGHFLGFIAGNYDKTSEFQSVFNREKSLYTMYNKAYVLSNASEYFAESFKNYTMDPAGLQASRPETYGAIQKALSKVTDGQVNNIMSVYKSIWNA